jgi:hypothetical protein
VPNDFDCLTMAEPELHGTAPATGGRHKTTDWQGGPADRGCPAV